MEKRYTVQEYFAELVPWAGEMRTRGSLIQEMQERGLSPGLINQTLFALDEQITQRLIEQ